MRFDWLRLFVVTGESKIIFVFVLDVALAEDDCSVCRDHAPENLARLRKIALNLLSQEKTTKIGVANKRLKAAWDNNYLAQVLGV